jgi:hypothetical protein
MVKCLFLTTNTPLETEILSFLAVYGTFVRQKTEIWYQTVHCSI